MGTKRKNRIAVILLSLIMVLTMMPSASFAAGEDQPDGGNEIAMATGTTGTEESGDNAEATAANGTDNENAAGGDAAEAGIGEGGQQGADIEENGTNETVTNADTDATVTEDSFYPDGFTMSIPVLKINVTKGKGGATETGKAAIDAMNASEDHSYKCAGTMDVLVPDGFSYSDQESGAALSSVTGIKLDQIRGRGNSTWQHPGKRPYRIRLKNAQSLLGMQPNETWALIANAFDPSMMRNRLTYLLGRQLNMDFTPGACPVDVFIGSDMDGDGDGKPDGYEYYGSYLLTHIPKNLIDLIDIDEPAESVTEGKNLTGGYLLSMMQDVGSDDVFVTDRHESLQNILPSYDKELDSDAYDNDTQKNYIRNYVQEAERSLFEGEVADDSEPSGYRSLDYHDYFDMDAASLYWMMQFFTANGDAYTTGSTYFYKTKDTDTERGKIFWGPLWDFDYAWNYADADPEDDMSNVMSWMVAMLGNKDGEFTELCRDNWNNRLKPALKEITEEDGWIDRYYEETKISQGCDYALNHEKYSRQTEDGRTEEDLAKDYKAEVENLRVWINTRIAWMDDFMKEELDDFSHAVRVKASPDDMHPQIFYIRDKYFFRESVKNPPEKEGYIFLGYFTDDTGDDLRELCIRKDIDATARYVKKEDATKITDIYFARNDVSETLERGDFTPAYKCLPEDAQDKTITWTSSDESVATVDSYGTVTFIKEGTVVITAHLSGGGSKSYNLTITDDIKNPETVTIEGGTIYLKPGEIGELKYSVSPAGAEYNLEISAEDEDIVYADEYGLLYAKKQGRTRVKVIASYFREGEGDEAGDWVDVSAECTVVVSDGSGSISTDVETEGVKGNASNLAEVAHAVLTAEEKELLAAGENIKVWLEMKTLDEDKVPAADKTLILGYMDKYGLTAGKYIDISLFKKIGENDAEAVHDSKVPVKFTITIPEELKLKNAAADGTGFNESGEKVTRTFYLLRVHDGKTECIAKGTGDKIECSSTHFSTYMLSYRDEKAGDEAVPVTDDDSDSGSSSSKTVKTGDNSFLLLWVAVLVLALLLGFIMLAIYRKNLDKKDEKDRE